ncbi:MAG: tRNA (guanosine(37)-N1)-methyltransferase TrmD [Deltaproteobacteria bacterium]|nr:tRNA (guanosine(37)-N1)-methyltransferase TrmD [Deltaproteobacteria bacterium]
MIRFDILSIFPEMFASPFDCSLIKKARENGLIEIAVHDIRSYAEDKHRMTDDAPYGGGGGMVMKVEPIARALDDLSPGLDAGQDGIAVVLLTPQGETFNQKVAGELSLSSRIILICGHYEGVDERVRAHLVNREISIGDYVLTGGELSAMVVVDAVSRLIPGVLGNSESASLDSFATGLLEHPHYTRPGEYRGWKVPDVLLSGNHRDITAWRRRESLRRTLARRPDLLEKSNLTEEDRRILAEIREEIQG